VAHERCWVVRVRHGRSPRGSYQPRDPRHARRNNWSTSSLSASVVGCASPEGRAKARHRPAWQRQQLVRRPALPPTERAPGRRPLRDARSHRGSPQGRRALGWRPHVRVRGPAPSRGSSWPPCPVAQ
jgi:hypothetical protein